MRSPLGALISRIRNAPQVPLVGRGGQSGTNRGSVGAATTTAELESLGSSSTLFSIVNKLATGTSSIDWHMHRIAQRAPRTSSVCDMCEAPGVTYVQAHPALSVLGRPNDFFTRQEFVETIQQHIDLTGEGWWLVEKIGGRPITLWPIRPDRMAPIRSADKFLAGYVYRGPDNELIRLELDEVVFIRMPNPVDLWRGMGPVQTLLNDIDSVRYSAEWNRRFFENSADPSGVIEVPETLSDESYKRLQQQWGEQHRGVSNAHRVAILENGTKWSTTQITNRDMQFVELRTMSREIMREAFGIHGHVLGLSEDVNRANAEAADVSYARRLLVPRADRWKGALNNDFLPLFGAMGKGYEFVYTSPVPEDEEADNAERASKTTAYATLVNVGVDPDDAALVCGLPPMRHTGFVAAAAQTGQRIQESVGASNGS